MALRIFERPPIAVLSTGILMASVMLLIIPTMDVNLLKAGVQYFESRLGHRSGKGQYHESESGRHSCAL